MRRQPPAFCRGPGVRVNTDVGDRAFALARALNYDPIARMDASPDDGARLTRVELVLRSSTGMSAVVAQMVRAPDCGSGGRWFDPSQRYHSSRRVDAPHDNRTVQNLFFGTGPVAASARLGFNWIGNTDCLAAATA